MTFNDLRKKEGRISGLVELEHAIPRKKRAKIKEFLILIVPLILAFLYFFEEKTYIAPEVLNAALLFMIAAGLIAFMVDCFYYAHYFRGTRVSVSEWGVREREKPIPYEVLEIVSHTEAADLTAGFLGSHSGKLIADRLHISLKKINAFVNGDRRRVFASPVIFPEPVSLVSYTEKVLEADPALVDFFADQSISKHDVVNTAAWITSIYERKKESLRWWGRDSLGRIRSIGKNWSRAEIPYLEKYGSYVMPETDEVIFKKEIDELERMLAQSSSANILLSAHERNEFVSVISGLSGRIRDGSVLPQIEHKQVLMLNGWVLTEQAHVVTTTANSTGGTSDGAEIQNDNFEHLLTRLFNEAVQSGNIILVIPDIEALWLAAKKHGINLAEFLAPYSASQELHLIACALSSSLSSFEHDTFLTKSFSHISINNKEDEVLIRALEHKIYTTERLTHVFFTYQSLRRIADIASSTLSGDAIEERVLRAFDKILPVLLKDLHQRKDSVVTADDVGELFKTSLQ